MPWPPTLPTGTRTDDVPQQATHPADHNLIATALGDLVARVDRFAPVSIWGSLQEGEGFPPNVATKVQIAAGGAAVGPADGTDWVYVDNDDVVFPQGGVWHSRVWMSVASRGGAGIITGSAQLIRAGALVYSIEGVTGVHGTDQWSHLTMGDVMAVFPGDRIRFGVAPTVQTFIAGATKRSGFIFTRLSTVNDFAVIPSALPLPAVEVSPQ